MLALLQSIAEALRLWLLVRAERARWDLEKDIDAELDALERAIGVLRDSGDPLDREHADRLLQRRVARQGAADSLRARLADAAGGNGAARPRG